MSSTHQDDSPLTFAALGLASPILQAIQAAGYETPSPIQAQSIPALLAGQDLLGQAQTGTGKTAAFALPLLSRIDVRLEKPQLLVLAPTRELAIQVAEAMQGYARHLPNFHILPIYGGQNIGVQLKQLRRNPQVIVGTPGRILDHIRRGTLQLDALRALVLDEADEMLRMGFIDDVEIILQETPSERQVALFSATMPGPIHRVAQRYLKAPVEVRIKAKTTTIETIDQRYWQVTGVHKLDALTRILEIEDFDGMIIFVRTKNATVELAEKLEARGYASSAINGDMNQALREKTIERMKNGSIDILIATDVAARGLDIERISHVVNYDIPYDTESYVHRIGRTGRAGRKGVAILFVAPRERRMLAAIERATRQTISRIHLPSNEEIADRRVMQFKAQLSETIETQDLAFFEHLLAQYIQEHDADPVEVAAALAMQLQKGRPLIPLAKSASEASSSATKSAASSRTDVPDARRERPASTTDTPRPRRERESGPIREHRTEIGMQTYRLEVGRQDRVEPKHIVGAIANEAGIDSQFIGKITIHDSYTLIDLPEGMPKDIFNHLRSVWVNQKQLQISMVKGQAAAQADASQPTKPGKFKTDGGKRKAPPKSR